MNKQELIVYCNDLKESKSRFINCIDVDRIIETIKQLDEPEKVKVPQCVEDWIEKCKNNFGFNLKSAMNINTILHYSDDCHKMIDWIKVNSNQELFARAWLDGYEVEKEKRYIVRIKGVVEDSAYLKHQLQNNHWYYGSLTECSLFSPYHTKKELEEADFGWVFDCEGIEIEEVEE
ncbi:DUF1642 domain-containing protein [Streptococcus mitis]|uniref:Phage protein n=1 Tax=Streptococcus mitis TaxID=28037 RepID=A0A428D4L9_STRMT|nr:DUF1642 domain-containing protein [Streptococcus mitis]RSI87081.1 hypothetical protein D8853_02990 [Streptococcus mitis]RSI90761.1 hypothetical protein D8848_05025 [Streptococcus mitis]